MLTKLNSRKKVLRQFLEIKKKIHELKTTERICFNDFISGLQPHIKNIENLGYKCNIVRKNMHWVVTVETVDNRIIGKTNIFTYPQHIELYKLVRLLPSMFTIRIRRAFDATTYYEGVVKNLPRELTESTAMVLSLYGYDDSGDTVSMSVAHPISCIDIGVGDI